MIIRKYRETDCQATAILFYDCVHHVNIRDYSRQQCAVWATGKLDLDSWNVSLMSHISLVAVEENEIIGFADIDNSGYLDRLYVHYKWQHLGVASALCDAAESAGNFQRITTQASITARPFFEKRGYRVLKQQQVERQGIKLTNYLMEKILVK